MCALRGDELAAIEALQRRLHRAFGEAGRVGNHPQARAEGLTPATAGGLAEEIEVNKKRGRMLIMADEVAHEDIDDIGIDREGRGLQVTGSTDYTFKGTVNSDRSTLRYLDAPFCRALD